MVLDGSVEVTIYTALLSARPKNTNNLICQHEHLFSLLEKELGMISHIKHDFSDIEIWFPRRDEINFHNTFRRPHVK